MTKGKAKVSNEAGTKPSAASDISQRPTLPRLPPRNRSSSNASPDESGWSTDEEEAVYNNGRVTVTPEELRRYLLIMRQGVHASLKAQRWKPFAGA